jgi:Tol biopolymer transport system component
MAREEYPSISADGRRVAYTSDQSGLRSVWVRDLANGKEVRVVPSPFAQRFPVLSGSGSRVAFSSYERDKRPAYAAPAAGGTPELLCGDCLRVTDWSQDETSILAIHGSPYRIITINTTTQEQTVLVRHSSFHVLYGRFSPDNRWVTFTVRRPNNRSWIAIAPVEGVPKPVAEEAWIKISEEGPEDRANWSSDGRTLYFTSGRDGWLCLWGQHLDAVTHRPLGDAFAAHHFHQRPALQQLGWSLQGGRVAMTLMESTGNIWMMTRPGHDAQPR